MYTNNKLLLKGPASHNTTVQWLSKEKKKSSETAEIRFRLKPTVHRGKFVSLPEKISGGTHDAEAADINLRLSLTIAVPKHFALSESAEGIRPGRNFA